jgi:hypothetical protein
MLAARGSRMEWRVATKPAAVILVLLLPLDGHPSNPSDAAGAPATLFFLRLLVLL